MRSCRPLAANAFEVRGLAVGEVGRRRSGFDLGPELDQVGRSGLAAQRSDPGLQVVDLTALLLALGDLGLEHRQGQPVWHALLLSRGPPGRGSGEPPPEYS